MSSIFYIATRNTLWIYVLEISNSYIATRHTKWIYVLIQFINTPSQPGQKMMGSRVFNLIVRKYKSNHAITGVEFEHGRNHLITVH